MDYKKLSGVKISDSSVEEKKAKLKAAIEKRKAIRDAAEKKKREEAAKLADSKKYSNFRITDAYKNLAKKIKDELSETETTEEAINVALEALQEAPAEQVLAAVTEVLGEAIDVLEAQAEPQEPQEPENPEEPAE